MTKGFDLILEYFTNRTKEGDSITNLGEGELQLSELDTLPENYVFEGEDTLYNVIWDIMNMYYEDEKKDWEASGKPDNHIFKDLEILKTLL